MPDTPHAPAPHRNGAAHPGPPRRGFRVPDGWAWILRMVVATVVLAIGAWIGVALGPPPKQEGGDDAANDGSAGSAAAYDASAQLVRRAGAGAAPLATGDRVRPDEPFSLVWRASQPTYVYVVDVDARGDGDLLFPHPLLDWKNPLPAGTQVTLPGTRAGREGVWSASPRAGRERVIVVASPHPVAALEARYKSVHARFDGPLEYARVDASSLAGVKDVRPLAGPETGVHGTWAREVALENAGR